MKKSLLCAFAVMGMACMLLLSGCSWCPAWCPLSSKDACSNKDAAKCKCQKNCDNCDCSKAKVCPCCNDVKCKCAKDCTKCDCNKIKACACCKDASQCKCSKECTKCDCNKADPCECCGSCDVDVATPAAK